MLYYRSQDGTLSYNITIYLFKRVNFGVSKNRDRSVKRINHFYDVHIGKVKAKDQYSDHCNFC